MTNLALLFINGENATIIENCATRKQATEMGLSLSGTCLVCNSKYSALAIVSNFKNIITLKQQHVFIQK